MMLGDALLHDRVEALRVDRPGALPGAQLAVAPHERQILPLELQQDAHLVA